MKHRDFQKNPYNFVYVSANKCMGFVYAYVCTESRFPVGWLVRNWTIENKFLVMRLLTGSSKVHGSCRHMRFEREQQRNWSLVEEN